MAKLENHHCFFFGGGEVHILSIIVNLYHILNHCFFSIVMLVFGGVHQIVCQLLCRKIPVAAKKKSMGESMIFWVEVQKPLPIRSMYRIFIYIWLECIVNEGKYAMHGSYALWFLTTG